MEHEDRAGTAARKAVGYVHGVGDESATMGMSIQPAGAGEDHGVRGRRESHVAAACSSPHPTASGGWRDGPFSLHGDRWMARVPPPMLSEGERISVCGGLVVNFPAAGPSGRWGYYCR